MRKILNFFRKRESMKSPCVPICPFNKRQEVNYGSFQWACQMMDEGKILRLKGDGHGFNTRVVGLNKFYFHPDYHGLLIRFVFTGFLNNETFARIVEFREEAICGEWELVSLENE